MRTTFDLKDELFRRAKIEAVRRGVSLKQLVEDSLSSVLSPIPKSRPGKRVKFPIISSKKRGKLKMPEDAVHLSQQREDHARHAASLRR